MYLRGDKCYPGRGKWVKSILEPTRTIERVMTNPENQFGCYQEPQSVSLIIPGLYFNTSEIPNLSYFFQISLKTIWRPVVTVGNAAPIEIKCKVNSSNPELTTTLGDNNIELKIPFIVETDIVIRGWVGIFFWNGSHANSSMVRWQHAIISLLVQAASREPLDIEEPFNPPDHKSFWLSNFCRKFFTIFPVHSVGVLPFQPCWILIRKSDCLVCSKLNATQFIWE